MRWPDVFFKPRPSTRKREDAPRHAAVSLPPAPVHPASSDSSVVQEMAEADTLRQMTRSGGIRLVKREFPATEGEKTAAVEPAAQPVAVPVAPAPAPEPVPSPAPVVTVAPAPEPVVPPEPIRRAPSINLAARTSPNVFPGATTVFRRKIKMADVARIVLPPRRDDTKAEPVEGFSPPHLDPKATPDEVSSAVVPPSFSVNVPTGSVLSEAPATVAEAKEEPPKQESLLPMVQEQGEKREFVLSNGERIYGRVLSESPDSIYLDHGTLGVVTIPRAQIAQRPVEIILVNGDRIVGDIIAETNDSLFVRHASLGVLTVPRNQRSNRVVEVILTDGDRILGEVLSETENFTVIRSATLGTVAVPHQRVAMLNRRAEEVRMKSLPAALPAPETPPPASY